MFKNEKVFNGEVEVKYRYQKSYKKTSSLIVVFSGIPPIGKNPSYNYVRTLQQFDANKLFILDDFGCRASYYLCKYRDFAIERSVIALIEQIIKEDQIKTVIATGSSKGGYASLYFGIKYGFDYIISASPQFLLGDYLLKQTNSQNMAAFISGETAEEDCRYMNGIMENMINESKNRPNILIHLGKGETHYTDHVKPLLKVLEKNNMKYKLDLGDYNTHNDVGVFFPPLLKTEIRNLLGYPYIESIKPEINEQVIHGTQTFYVETDSSENKIAWYLFHEKQRIEVQGYSNDNTFTVKFEKEGTYEVTVFVVNKKGMKVAITTPPIDVRTMKPINYTNEKQPVI